MRIALGQLNPIVGDLNGNLAKMSTTVAKACADNCDLVIFPEMSVTGYPPLDLLDRPSFIDAAKTALNQWATALPDIAVLCGTVERNTEPEGRKLWNAAAFIRNQRVESIHPKTLLPTYDVFDEDRWFEPMHTEPTVVDYKGCKLGITVCEDIWNMPLHRERARYHIDPVKRVVDKGADIIINISASPFSAGKHTLRHALLRGQATTHNKPIFYVNQVGGNDGLIFDGRSLVVTEDGSFVAEGKGFEEDYLILDTDNWPDPITPSDPTDDEDIYSALILGVSDYFKKVGCTRAVIGLSGGIDSAVTAAVAVDALGKDNVVGITMPSEFSSEGSVTDARELAENLGIAFHVVPIQSPLDAMRGILEAPLGPKPWGVADENLQARTRGMILMGYSNRHGHLVLSTGNKSELAVGYCTLYGDMCGGLAVLSDVPKVMVYQVSEYINRDKVRIPVNTITKPPSAELRPDQRDDQSLPPYEILDQILQLYVEERLEITAIVDRGFEQEIVAKVIRLVDRAEYKRRQMPVGLRVTSKAFGSGRRLPIAQRWTEHPDR